MFILILPAIVILIVFVIIRLVFYVFRYSYSFPFRKYVIIVFEINVWNYDNNSVTH